MDAFSIRERLAELMEEVGQLSKEDLEYKKTRRCTSPPDIVAHNQRVIRMKQILEEIARLMKRPG